MDSILTLISILLLIVIAIILVATNIRIVPQAHAYVIERLGAYNGTWQVGLHIKIPLIDKIAKKVSLKEHVIDFPPQPVITKDNVTMEIDTVIYFQITDPKLYATRSQSHGAIEPYGYHSEEISSLSWIILSSRRTFNSKSMILGMSNDPWGIKSIG